MEKADTFGNNQTKVEKEMMLPGSMDGARDSLESNSSEGAVSLCLLEFKKKNTETLLLKEDKQDLRGLELFLQKAAGFSSRRYGKIHFQSQVQNLQRDN